MYREILNVNHREPLQWDMNYLEPLWILETM